MKINKIIINNNQNGIEINTHSEDESSITKINNLISDLFQEYQYVVLDPYINEDGEEETYDYPVRRYLPGDARAIFIDESTHELTINLKLLNRKVSKKKDMQRFTDKIVRAK